jgi:hypothetical protein
MKEIFKIFKVKLFERHDITTVIADLYMEIKETILKELEKIEFCSITTDGWSSKFQKKAFISLTIHYLDEYFKPVKISLGIIPADYNHNAQNLAKHLKALLYDHKIKKSAK